MASRFRLRGVLILSMAAFGVGFVLSGCSAADELSAAFGRTVKPFLNEFCLDCHGATDPEAKLNLSSFVSAESVAESHQTWETVLQRLEAGEMPPAEAPQPNSIVRDSVVEWIRAFRRSAAERDAGNPGPVLVRRLSNAEYNYTIREITGVDIRPTAEFPVDPANEAGFDNSGESLTMSPALLTKYLAAARQVGEHLVLTPDGYAFAPHPVVTDTDRDKYCVKRIIQFYERQPTDPATYFLAAWLVKTGRASSAQSAAQQLHVSHKYLRTIIELLTEPDAVGPVAEVQRRFAEIEGQAANVDDARRSCSKLHAFVQALRRKLTPIIEEQPQVDGIHKGAQPFVLWRNRFRRDHRRSLNRDALIAKTDDENSSDPELRLPADESLRRRHVAAFERFCSVFPDAFYISERGRDYVEESSKQQGEKGRLLSAGFHSMMGYFRDDRPLYELILESDEQRELDRLWQELDFVASAPMRQYVGFLWFERTDSRFMRDPQFDFARPENKSSLSQPMIQKLAQVYLNKAVESGAGSLESAAIQTYFDEINDQIRWVKRTQRDAEDSHLTGILEFAHLACRRPLTELEQQEIRSFYAARKQDGLTHEDAIQDTLVSVLMSPRFLYRVDLIGSRTGIHPLDDYDLASRLSYFLWGCSPDAELIRAAQDGELSQPQVLRAQTRRMLQDGRIRRLAVEFGGHWLDFRRFEEHNSVDRGRFPQFTDELRASMFEEPVRFFVDLVRRNGSVLEFVNARHTFVNRSLARHYGIPFDDPADQSWRRVSNAGDFGRGGLLPMSVFLTKNSPGLRTSPVKRGYWVVRRLLGERIPPPPPDVPEIPDDESELGDLTLRETLARHRENSACAGCHDRFDSVGLAMEGFGPTGERRDKDLGGRPVVATARFPGAGEYTGLDGLRDYLQRYRRDEFIDNYCRKLLAYALGRTLILSDDLLLEDMKAQLLKTDYRIGPLFETIVCSPQFLNKRGG